MVKRASKQQSLCLEQMADDQSSFVKDATVDEISDVGSVAIGQPSDVDDIADVSAKEEVYYLFIDVDFIWDEIHEFGDVAGTEEGENETVAANSQVAAKVDASDVDSVSGCCYGRSVMLQLSRKANNHFFSRRGLEELGIYLHRGSIDTESAAPKTFLDALTDAARGTGNDPFKGSAETKVVWFGSSHCSLV
ncbi:unnamed protein product [Toxocara canis]|uniref:DUF2235 domain-containing protein n=1 Tax=Toxocara canis TaxID=6265 RepID=A0A183U2U0_TOXCA|nr:unnamed protein product [Toxocara canis]